MLVICELLFGLSVAAILYVYAGFPVSLLILTRGRRHTPPKDLTDAQLPSVSLIVAAYNEELVIETKLRNCLSIDYPADKLNFIFVSDSNDRTNEILQRYQSPRIRVLILPERRGKVHALAAAHQVCDADILVFSDANTWYKPESIRKLVRHFSDPEVGVVTGDVRLLPSAQPFGTGEGFYYRYERKLQELETTFWSTVAIDGAMYALRRVHLQLPSSGLIADDFVTGMNVGLRGLRILYDPQAIAEEDPTPTDGQEFKRKVRVVAFAIQSFLKREGVPDLSQGKLWWTYVSHKLLRWMVPVFLTLALMSNLGAALFSRVWLLALALHLACYALALAAWRFPRLQQRIFRIPYYFVMVNTAALFGLWRGLLTRQRSVWMRTERLVQGQ